MYDRIFFILLFYLYICILYVDILSNKSILSVYLTVNFAIHHCLYNNVFLLVGHGI